MHKKVDDLTRRSLPPRLNVKFHFHWTQVLGNGIFKILIFNSDKSRITL